VTSLRVVASVAPKLARAFALPDCPERDTLLEEAIGEAIDAGRQAGEALKKENERLRGERDNAEQAKILLVKKVERLEGALREVNERIRRMER
jgi:hypothetical protein